MEQSTAGSVAYSLEQRRRHAATTGLFGLLVGGGIAFAAGGPLLQRLVLTAVAAVAVAGGSYWLLRRLAEMVSGGSGHYRLQYPGTAGDGSLDGGTAGNGRRTPEGR